MTSLGRVERARERFFAGGSKELIGFTGENEMLGMSLENALRTAREFAGLSRMCRPGCSLQPRRSNP